MGCLGRDAWDRRGGGGMFRGGGRRRVGCWCGYGWMDWGLERYRWRGWMDGEYADILGLYYVKSIDLFDFLGLKPWRVRWFRSFEGCVMLLDG